MTKVLTLQNESSSVVTFYVTGSDGKTRMLALEAGESVDSPLKWNGPGSAGLVSGMINGSEINQVLPSVLIENADTTLRVLDGVVWERDTDPATRLGTTQLPDGEPGVFAIQKQQMSKWCWAAVTSSVVDFYGSAKKTQGELANSELKLTSCDVKAPPSECNKPFATATALRHVGHLNATTPDGLTLSKVETEIAAQHPIAMSLNWPNKTIGHAIVISGYAGAGDTATITVQDPATASTSIVSFKGFPGNSYPDAIWKRSYTTK
ncbi:MULTISPECIES: papain-like cysteine protease family protein [unclassified Duganella]|uniref:papain-like cysteine protease family protein n=1 Tax=unclassified Duganella TaxID=2636909 RepID=UPI0008884A2F|nr:MULTISPECIES: papain-like cysteine protease family protein [unclassified Duganella]SDF58525.1 Peptidase_C39 like family protein [Duganella sp. OV458]SDI70073.1 Papain-like cysteine protease AvrRpt2 [Duganella sp. OV510]